MCGIAGIVELSGRQAVPARAVRAMTNSIIHRGPDEEGFLDRPRLTFGSRRLSIVGLADGQQPIHNEDRSVSVVFNGEFFDYPEAREELEKRGHRFATHTDTELLPHRWEEDQEGMFVKLRGQFAVALFDNKRQRVVLGRDRFGICPLFWTRQRTANGDFLLFASEIKALLASGFVDPQADLNGINHLFTFFGIPGPVTCFKGVQALQPGHYLRIDLGESGEAKVTDHTYWEMEFPDEGSELIGDPRKLIDEFEALLQDATRIRLRADVPVVSYLSGGLDSTTVAALAKEVRGTSVPLFTIQIQDPDLDEVNEATLAARSLGTEPHVLQSGAADVLRVYPRLIQAAESPVVDTSCAALLQLSGLVHQSGYRVALTGEGSDEWLAGYPWYKISRVLSWLDFIPGLPLSFHLRRLLLKVTGSPTLPRGRVEQVLSAVGGPNPWLDPYGMMSLSKIRFFNDELLKVVENVVVYEQLGLKREKLKRWHPLHRGLYMSGRIHLPGLLLQAKGDRIAMANSVETRYPFLDERVFDFLAKLHPSYKLRRLTDKWLLRKVAERRLPKSIAWRSKAMFRAPFDSFHGENVPPFVDQLLSEEALKRTGYFNVQAVQHWRQAFRTLGRRNPNRLSIEMGLAGVIATQLWHQTYIDNGLADLPSVNFAKPEQTLQTQPV